METRQRHRARNIVLGVVAALVVLLAGAAVWGYTFVNGVTDRMVYTDQKVLKALTPKAQDDPAPKAFTMLLLGVDKDGSEGNSRSDTILVARVDPAAKSVWLLSLPRDTRAEIPGYGVAKLNKAYQLGGAALTIDTVEQLTGVDINHYMQVNVIGFRQLVRILGGVWVDVDTDIDDPRAAHRGAEPEEYQIEAGYRRLTPEQALVFVRSRDFPDADFTRMRHQQQFFKAVATQAMDVSNPFKLAKLVSEASRQVKTDLGASELLRLSRSLKGMKDENLHTATMSGEWRSPYVVTDEKLKSDLIARMMSGRSFEDSSVVGAPVPADVSVSVRNGSGVGGVATAAGNLLEGAGFDVREIGNAKRSDYDETLVVYSGTSEDAKAVADALGGGQLVMNDGDYGFGTDVLVVVGKDWQQLESDGPQQVQ